MGRKYLVTSTSVHLGSQLDTYVVMINISVKFLKRSLCKRIHTVIYGMRKLIPKISFSWNFKLSTQSSLAFITKVQ